MLLFCNLAIPLLHCYVMPFCRYYIVRFVTYCVVNLFNNYVLPRMSCSTIQIETIGLTRSVHSMPGIRSAVFTTRAQTQDCCWLLFDERVCPECKASEIGATFPEMLSSPVMPQSCGSVIPLSRNCAITRLRYYIVTLWHSYVIA